MPLGAYKKNKISLKVHTKREAAHHRSPFELEHITHMLFLLIQLCNFCLHKVVELFRLVILHQAFNIRDFNLECHNDYSSVHTVTELSSKALDVFNRLF